MAARAEALAPPVLLPLPPRSPLLPRFPNPNTRSPLRPCLVGGEIGGGGPPAEEDKKEHQGRPSLLSLSNIRWRDLLSPEPTKATAVVLTGAPTWAGASLLFQLALIFFSIIATAIKYSITAVLLFILIALLSS